MYFSLFCENLVRCQIMDGINAFFVIVVSSMNSEKVYHMRTNVPEKAKVHDEVTSTTTCHNRRIGDSLRDIVFNVTLASPGDRMADQEFHCILSIALEYIKENGKTGFPLVVGDTCFVNRYAILDFRADMPAGNFLRGFPGRHSSSNPCPRCAVARRVYDPVACMTLDSAVMSQHARRTQLKTLNSAVTTLAKEHPLRLLSAFLWSSLQPEGFSLIEDGILRVAEKEMKSSSNPLYIQH